jgi:hypothetical protein
MAYQVAQLLQMTAAELDQLFRESEPGPIPDGEADGTMIIAPGTSLSPHIAKLINSFAWQGKIFDAASGVLKNRILPFGINAIVARVYKAPSRFDGRECILLDYSETSLVAHWIRDEIRLIQPKMYLGKAYWREARPIDFVLEFA